MKSTRHVDRCVNPKWRQTLQFADVADNEEKRLLLQVMDYSHVSEDAALTAIIAYATVPVGDDFTGWLELQAA